MATRDRYSWRLRCESCGRTGEVHVSEDDHPYMRKPNRTVDSISEGFTVISVRQTLMDETNIQCHCGHRVH